MRPFQHGLIAGRFLVPHLGHRVLCRTAEMLSAEVTVLVLREADDPVPQDLRAAWMAALVPGARVLVADGNHAEAADQVRLASTGTPIDAVFGGDERILPCAGALGARPVPVDLSPRAVELPSQDLLNDPRRHWAVLAPPVRPWLQKRVTLMGAESTGKSTLAARLSDGGMHVPEYGRSHERMRHGEWTKGELIRLAACHEAHRAAIAEQAGPILIEDTDPLTTAVWARMLLGRRVPALETRPLPGLFLLMSPDTPFIQDGIRYFDGAERQRFHDLCLDLLEARNARYLVLTGTWAEREAAARAAIADLAVEPWPGRWTLPTEAHPVHAAGSHAEPLLGD